MNLINLLKKKKDELLEANQKLEEVPQEPSIEIVIENHHSEFSNEEEIIKKGARDLLATKAVESLEEGIIVFASIFRGLRYKETIKDDDGNIKIYLKDLTIENRPKTL